MALLAVPEVPLGFAAGECRALRRAVEVYETDQIDFAEAYLVACAETTGIGQVASFDRSIDRANTIERIEPPPV